MSDQPWAQPPLLLHWVSFGELLLRKQPAAGLEARCSHVQHSRSVLIAAGFFEGSEISGLA